MIAHLDKNPMGSVTTVFRYPCRVECDGGDHRPAFYTYQPHRYTDPSAPVTTTSWLKPDGTGSYPFFGTPDEALAYMVEGKIYGHVQRYLITDDLEDPKRTLVLLSGDQPITVDNHPWLTAGVVRCVEPLDMAPDKVHAAPLLIGKGGITKEGVRYV